MIDEQEMSPDDDEMVCDECEQPMMVDENEVTHHVRTDEEFSDGIDHDADIDHVARNMERLGFGCIFIP